MLKDLETIFEHREKVMNRRRGRDYELREPDEPEELPDADSYDGWDDYYSVMGEGGLVNRVYDIVFGIVFGIVLSVILALGTGVLHY